VMCPTYRAADEESLSTRGRANLLRQAMSGDLTPEEQFDPEFVDEVLSLCVGCKGCARDCPSEVDMAKLKAELKHASHQRHGTSLRERFFGNVERVNALGAAFAPVSNWMASVPGARTVLEKTLGIARERSLPTFHRETLLDWYAARGSCVAEADADRRVLFLPDPYTNYNHPEAGKAAIRLLEAAGVHVALPDSPLPTGRPAHSQGLLAKSRVQARALVDEVGPLVENGWDVVLVEPSDAVMLQSDYLDLLTGPDVERVAANTYGVLEYLDRFDLSLPVDGAGEAVTYHGHCHQKATRKDHHAATVLADAGFDVDALDSGCCGMAGSFGYEAEHYSLSRSIGELLFEQVDASPGERVVAPGASCRTQLGDRPGESEPVHPVELLAEKLG